MDGAQVAILKHPNLQQQHMIDVFFLQDALACLTWRASSPNKPLQLLGGLQQQSLATEGLCQDFE